MADIQIRKRNLQDRGGLHDWMQGTAASCHPCRSHLKSLMKTIILHSLLMRLVFKLHITPNITCFVVLQLGTLE